MTDKKLHIDKEYFIRYLENKMTDTERNLFEKELQKHPFEAEALEGLATISPENIENDLNKITAKIKPQQRNCFRCFAAAASILLVVSAGVVWMEVRDQNMVSEMAETKTLEKQYNKPINNREILIVEKDTEKTDEVEITPQIENKEVTATATKSTIVENKMYKKSAAKNSIPKKEVTQLNNQDESVVIVEDETETDKPETKSESFSVEPDNITKKSTRAKNIQYYQAAPVNAVVGAAVPAPPAEPEIERIDTKAIPSGGFENYKIYLDSVALLSDNFDKKKVVVKIQFDIDSLGLISNFQNKNSADSLLFSRAKEIVLTGPKWLPETEDEKRVKSTVKLKVVFRK